MQLFLCQRDRLWRGRNSRISGDHRYSDLPFIAFWRNYAEIYSAQHTLSFCRKAAPVIWVLLSVFRPLSNLLVRSTFVINRVAQKRKKQCNLSVDELSQALELTDKSEISEETNMLEGIIRFGEETAKEVMTSRLDMVDLDIEASYSEVLKCIVENAYSRIPVYQENRDNVKGILYIKDLLPIWIGGMILNGRT